jgi:glycosyltransferase involved in cell wall biosynthesis
VKIAQISPLYEAVPPKLYGGTERVVAHLCDALVDLGHDVTLFSSADAQTKARLAPVRDQAIRLDPAPYKSDLASHMAMLHEVRQRADEFDVLHFHTDMIHFPFFEDMAERTITTLHGRLDLKGLGDVYARWPQFRLVSISDAQRAPLAWSNWAGTVLHGMRADLYPFQGTPEGYLLFLGRISPEKGPERAISIAKRVGMPLKIAAKAIRPTPSTSARRSSRCSTIRWSSSWARSAARPSPACWAGRGLCCSRSTGPSRSAWS